MKLTPINEYIQNNYPNRRQMALDWGKTESAIQRMQTAKKPVYVVKVDGKLRIFSELAKKSIGK